MERPDRYPTEDSSRGYRARRNHSTVDVKVVRALGRGPSTVRRSLGALIDRGFLREEERRGASRMRFEDPFFAHWIRMFTESL